MTEAEHAEIIREEEEGKLLIGIDPSLARKFYTDMSIKFIESKTGEPPYLETILVYILMLGSPIALLGACALAVIHFQWWSIAIIPALMLLWIGYHVISSRGTARSGFITLVTIAVIAVHIIDPLGLGWTLFLVFAALSLWFSRTLYTASTFFLRGFVIRNYRAFDFLEDAIVIKRV